MASVASSTYAVSRILDARSGVHGRSLAAVATRLPMQQLQGLQCNRNSGGAFRIFSVAAEQIDGAAVTSTEELSLVSPTEELSPLTPTPEEIQSLLTQVCDETKIAELELKVGAFELRVKRSLEKPEAAAAAAAPVLAPVAASTSAVAAAPAPALAPTSAAPKPSGPRVSPLMTKAAFFDELHRLAEESGLVFVTSPKVGLFRQSRVVKGKQSRPLCREGQSVKEGQVVCYLEQLGTSSAVESEVAGEVIKILYEDGAPVGYGDPLIAVKPKKP